MKVRMGDSLHVILDLQKASKCSEKKFQRTTQFTLSPDSIYFSKQTVTHRKSHDLFSSSDFIFGSRKLPLEEGTAVVRFRFAPEAGNPLFDYSCVAA